MASFAITNNRETPRAATNIHKIKRLRDVTGMNSATPQHQRQIPILVLSHQVSGLQPLLGISSCMFLVLWTISLFSLLGVVESVSTLHGKSTGVD